MRARIGTILFRYRNAIGPSAFVLALLLSNPSNPWGRPELDTVFDVIGFALALGGEALRMMTIAYEYIERGGRNRQVHASNLVQGGVFGHCRNPLYLGNILIGLGFALIVNAYPFYLLASGIVPFAYGCIVMVEEAYLRQKFGAEYETYCRRVNRWWPRWVGWKRSIEGMSFNWSRVLAKEYNTIFILLLALVGLWLWSEYRIIGRTALPDPASLGAALGAWLVVYFVVRALKKGRYLEA
jgi:protein-S-isoprenylcysteine O-methyltransferase Ste14